MQTKALRILLLFVLLPVWLYAQPFITTWKTDNPGATTDTQIEIPTTGVGYDYNINWVEVGNPAHTGTLLSQTGTTIIDFGSPGTYRVEITGQFPRIFFNAGLTFSPQKDSDKLLSVDQWGSIGWTSMSNAFAGCENLRINAIDAPDLSGVTDMSRMFFNASVLNDYINHWDVSTITNMSGLFRDADAFNQPLDTWDVSSVINMSELFYFAGTFNQDLNTWVVDNVTNMESMFGGAVAFNGNVTPWHVDNVTNMGGMFSVAELFNQDISGWQITSATDLGGMFSGATAFNQDISTKIGGGNNGGDAWNTNGVLNMAALFKNAVAFSQPITNWDVSTVTNMREMFAGHPTFNQNITGWTVDNVTDMRSMFELAPSFNQDISGWDVTKVNDFNGMFANATSFNQPIGSWTLNTISNIDMRNMFAGATSFDRDLSGWNVSKLTLAVNMFYNSGLSVANYDLLLEGWAAQSVNPGVNFGAQGVFYCSAGAARTALIAAGWFITDGGTKCISLFAGPDTSAPEIFNGQPQAIDYGSTSTTKTRNFTILNNQGIPISVDIANPGVGFPTTLNFPSIPAGGTQTFSISLTGPVGTYTETVDITSPNFSGPFQFDVSGEVTTAPEPEIAVFEGPTVTGTPILDGQVPAFQLGIEFRGNSLIRDITITNIGDADLNISDITFTGTEFQLVSTPPTIIPVDGTEIIQVLILGNTGGQFLETLTITSDDTDETSFNFGVFAEIIGPDIWVVDGVDIFSDPEILNGQVTPIDFGSAPAGSDIVRQLTITDATPVNLAVTNISISGTAFSFTPAAPFGIAGEIDGIYDKASFEITLSGAVAGTYTETVTILSDDDADPVFEFQITGTITTPPMNLLSSSPASNLNNVPSNANISLDFDQNIDGTTANNANIIVRGEQTGLIQGIYSGAGTSTITFDPTVDFKAGEVIYVTISQGLLSTIGATLPGSFSFQFTAASASGPATPDFFYNTTATQLPISTSQPRGFNVIDVDSDGDLDVVMVSSGDDKVSWYENDGTQSFTEHVIYSTADFAIGIDAVDLDDDGDIDFLVASEIDNQFAWFRNDGSENFTRIPITTGTSSNARLIQAHDIDGDGDLDLVTGSRVNPSLSWHENNGSEVFTEHTIANTAADITDLKVVDVDGDGDLDIGASYFIEGQLAWYENDGAQNFSEQVIVAGLANVHTFDTNDLDGDGDKDFVAAVFTTDAVYWFQNDGSEIFSQSTILSRQCNNITVRDMDGDSDLDILLTGTELSWLENDGSENFTEFTIDPTGGQQLALAADMDQDGDLDIVATSTGGPDQLAWYENTLLLRVTSTSPAANSNMTSVTADIVINFNQVVDASTITPSNIIVRSDRRGVLSGALSGGGTSSITFNPSSDFISGEMIYVTLTEGLLTSGNEPLENSYGYKFDVVTNTGPDTPDFFADLPANHLTVSQIAETVYSADVDSDGDMDIIGGLQADQLSWFENDGTQNFTEHFVNNIIGILQVHATDLDVDGDIDLIVQGDDTFNWFENDGGENFTPHVIDDFTPLQSIGQSWPVDLDGDGDLDFVIVYTAFDEVAWYKNDGSQNFTKIVIDNAAIEASSVRPVDMNGDGLIDIIATYNQNTIAIYYNDGTQTFTQDAISVPWTASHVGLTGYATDIDGDLDVDLIYSNNGGFDNVWLENDGAGSFTQHAITGMTGGERLVVVDMDGDADMDILNGVFNVGVFWYENDGSENFTEHPIVGVASWVDVAAVDLDNDSDLDVVVTEGGLAWYENSLKCPDPPTVNAGVDVSICPGDVINLSGTIGGSATIATWTSTGTGTFDDDLSLAAIYTPTPADEAAGTVTLTLTVAATSLCPQSNDDLTVSIGQPVTAGTPIVSLNVQQVSNIDVLAQSTVNAGDVITITLLSNGTKGTATVKSDNTIDYISNTGTVGADSFQYRICNQCGFCGDGTVSVNILNQAPVFTPPSAPITTLAGQSITIPFSSYFSDVNDNIDFNSIQIIDGPTSNAEATFDSNFNLTIDYANTPFAGTDELTIEVCDLLGVCAQITIQIEVDGEITVFNGISPNGDGLNDYFQLQNIQFLEPNNKVNIFNRWGDKVYEQENYNPDDPERRFEGRQNNGTSLPNGIYFYKVEFRDGRPELSGYLTLKK